MLPLRGVQSRLRFRDRLLALSPLLFPGRLFLAALGIPTLLLALELRGGLFRESPSLILGAARRFGSGRRAFFFGPSPPSPRSGRSACSANCPLDPAGRFSTTPGFAMAAATTSGSSVSLAKPWWKRLLPAPHASSAAFMDGAAIARS